MDEYSYISENGAVRQIRDLIAKAKDEEQDTNISNLSGSLQIFETQTAANLAARVRTVGTEYVTAANQKDFLKAVAAAAINGHYIDELGMAVLISGGWSGVSYGVELIQRISPQYISVTFLGQEYFLSGIYDQQNDLMSTAVRYEGTIL